MRFIIRMSYGGTRKANRFYGTWESREKAQAVADRWKHKVAPHFFGDVWFDVIELGSSNETLKNLRDQLRSEGMN